MNLKKAKIICGPTGSGKTMVAHHMACKQSSCIINCDSIQVYQDIEIISAAPSKLLQQELPYHLYSYRKYTEPCSVAYYLQDLKLILDQQENIEPIIVGGTGMYINAILNGISDIPEIDPGILSEIEEAEKRHGLSFLFNKLQAIDPIMSNKLQPNDSQRIKRALSVKIHTGKSIAQYQNSNKQYFPQWQFDIIFLHPERKFLYENCNNRFDEMLRSGTLDEVSHACNQLGFRESLAYKALGLQEIDLYLQGKLSKDKMIELAKQKTRNYAKRQLTWFRNQLPKSRKEVIFDNASALNNICN